MTHNLINAAVNQDRRDGIDAVKISMMHGPMVQKLLKSIRSCGVPFKISNADKITSLVGGDKLELCQRTSRIASQQASLVQCYRNCGK